MFRDVHPDFEPDDQRLEYDFQYILRKDLLGDYDEDAIHEDWQQAWIDRVGNAASVDGFFDEHRDLLVKHFGVSVWTSHVQPNQRYWVKGNEGSQTTVTYLTLPQPRMRECRWADSENDCDCGNMPIVESGYGIPVELANTPTPASLKRFARALKILDLSVFVHATQRGQTLGCSHADEADTEHKSKTTNTWPKLMLLLRSVPAY
nr:hypothetical protein B0A51_10125 [Rachicladosporium sp. CCFEE 5018]